MCPRSAPVAEYDGSEVQSTGTRCKFSFHQDLSKKLLGYPTLQPLVINDTVADGDKQSLLILMDNGVGLGYEKVKKGAHTLKDVKDTKDFNLQTT